MKEFERLGSQAPPNVTFLSKRIYYFHQRQLKVSFYKIRDERSRKHNVIYLKFIINYTM